MKNLRIIVEDDRLLKEGSQFRNHEFDKIMQKLLGEKRMKNCEQRLKKYEGDFLEVGSYLIPGVRLPFLEQAQATIDTSENVGLSKRGKVRLHYKSKNYDEVREINSNGIFMRIDDPVKTFHNKTVPELRKITEKYNYIRYKIAERYMGKH